MDHYQLRRRIMLVSAAALAAVPTGAGSASGAEEGTRCFAELVVALAPGIGSEPASGVFHTDGGPGTFVCGGRSGTLEEDGRYGTGKGATCASGGDGWGVHSITLDGRTIRNTFTFDTGGLANGVISGRFDGERYSGTFTVTPTEGDCVSQPITKGRVKLEGVLR